MNTIVALFLAIFILLALCGFWGTIFSRAGFSAWWCLGMPIPILNIAIALMLVIREWPVHKQLRDLRASAGSPNGEDAESLFREANRLEVGGSLIEAVDKYRKVIELYPDTDFAKDASISIEEIKKRIFPN